jgi:hypothetical protein
VTVRLPKRNKNRALFRSIPIHLERHETRRQQKRIESGRAITPAAMAPFASADRAGHRLLRLSKRRRHRSASASSAPSSSVDFPSAPTVYLHERRRGCKTNLQGPRSSDRLELLTLIT